MTMRDTKSHFVALAEGYKVAVREAELYQDDYHKFDAWIHWLKARKSGNKSLELGESIEDRIQEFKKEPFKFADWIPSFSDDIGRIYREKSAEYLEERYDNAKIKLTIGFISEPLEEYLNDEQIPFELKKIMALNSATLLDKKAAERSIEALRKKTSKYIESLEH